MLFRRDPEPPLKPGITWTRLVIFLVVVVALAVVAERFATGQVSSNGNCASKGISAPEHKEGTCTQEGHNLVVVNEHSVLMLESLEARLEGVDKRRRVSGPAGSVTAKGQFLTFDLALTNRTDSPARFAAGQAVLLLGTAHGEDVEVDEGYEPHSFLARGRAIPPLATEHGTVTFAVPTEEVAALRKEGNLDLENFGADSDPLEPEAIFDAPELGVIRTYQ